MRHRKNASGLGEGLIAVLALIVSVAGLVLSLVQALGITKELGISLMAVLAAGALSVASAQLAILVRRFQRQTRIFISYSHKDVDVAKRIALQFQHVGAKVWFDQEQIQPGDSITQSVERGVADADAVVVIIPENPSAFLEREISLAKKQHIRILPVSVGSRPIPQSISEVKYIDISEDRESGLKLLVESVDDGQKGA